MKHEAVILCGGEGWRLKPDTWIPKPLLQISETRTLLDRQIGWLLEAEFDKIVLASNRSFPESTFFTNPKVEPCIERRKLGTGGAVKRALTLINEERFYVMNVDDIVFLNPNKLYEKNKVGAAMLLARPQLPFGEVTLEGDQILEFYDRPHIDTWVNAGHYVFSKKIVEKYFPSEGDFEKTAMQQLSKDKQLRGLKYEGDWLTLNTMKDLIKIRDFCARAARDGVYSPQFSLFF
jgi:NDP-sugar pyrophosphorylase family protein